MLSVYAATVIDRELVNDTIVTLTLKKPDGFMYESGQYCIIPFAGRDVYMSLVTHPSDELVRIAFRVGASPLKNYLQSLRQNDTLLLQKPDGHFVLGDKVGKAPMVFLAGGIGITPIRSLIGELARREHDTAYHLFHSSRTPSEALFGAEFTELSQKHPKFTYAPVYTRVTQTEKNRRISADMLVSVQDAALAEYYIAGSHSFVASMITLLLSMGVPSERIRTEVFCGYCSDHECCCDAVNQHLHCTH